MPLFEAVVVIGPRHRTSLSPHLARRVAALLGSRRGRAAGAAARLLEGARPGGYVELSRRQERVFHAAVLEVTMRHLNL